MNKLTIPAILVATVMVAGVFAFMPVEQASTVHTTAAFLSNQEVIKTVTVTELTVTNNQVITIDLDAPFELLSLSVSCDTGDTVDAAGAGDCGALEDMGIVSYTRDGETTAQLLTITDLAGTDTEADADRVLFVFDGNTAAVTTDQTGSIAVADRIAIIMANDIVDGGDASDGYDLTVTAVIRVNANITFDATDIDFT